MKVFINNKLLARHAWFSGPFGLMFKRLRPGEACVLTNNSVDRIGAGIHMLFVPQELDIIWTDDKMRVVDLKHCKQWRFYWPNKPAKYVIEMLDAKKTRIGDKISFIS